MPSSVRTKRSSRGSAPVSSRTAASIAAVSMSISSPAAVSFSGSRCVCTDAHLGHVAARIAASTCSAISCARSSGEVARELQVERDLDAPVDVEHRQVVDLAHVRDGERGGEDAFANPAVAAARLDVDDDVDPRERVVQRLLDAVGRRVALADRGSRRDADDDVGEVLPSRSPQPEPPELDGRIERRDRPARDPRVVLGRPIHEHVDVPAREPHRGGDDERRRRRAPRSSRRRGSRARQRSGRASTASVPAKSLPKWSAFASSASLR